VAAYEQSVFKTIDILNRNVNEKIILFGGCLAYTCFVRAGKTPVRSDGAGVQPFDGRNPNVQHSVVGEQPPVTR